MLVMPFEHQPAGLNILQPAPTAIDPVCGMSVDPNRAAGGSHAYKGTTYYFCCASCRTKFAADPERYLDKSKAPAKEEKPAPPGTMYTCPMDPEIVQEGPGTCPKCGMALEPMQPTAETGPDPELVSMQRRFLVAA